MKTELFNYDLPQKFIAQEPVEPRDSSKLMVIDRLSDEIKHRKFYEIQGFLEKGDCLVINETKVRPARIKGKKKSTGAKIEMLLLKNINNNTFEALIKGAKRLKEGDEIVFANFSVIVEKKNESGLFEISSEINIEKALQSSGNIPLPPYIKEYRGPIERYQTVYAKKPTSVAAPTAGLHFTENVFEKIKEKGVNIATVNLSVGWETFRPVREDEIEEHRLHSEEYEVTEEAADLINQTIESGKKVIAVGTTSVRVLESSVDNQRIIPQKGSTNIFIYPGYEFKIVNGLITNFHLPKSTLLMLVSAFTGRKFLLKAYEEAKKNNYRFFSFGDAMFIIGCENHGPACRQARRGVSP